MGQSKNPMPSLLIGHGDRVTELVTGVTLSIWASNAYRTSEVRLLSLRQTAYKFVSFTFDFSFCVTTDWTVEYSPVLDECVSGRGTQALIIWCKGTTLMETNSITDSTVWRGVGRKGMSRRLMHCTKPWGPMRLCRHRAVRARNSAAALVPSIDGTTIQCWP